MGQLPAKNFDFTLRKMYIKILMKRGKKVLLKMRGSKMCLEENRLVENQLDGGRLELHLDPDPE